MAFPGSIAEKALLDCSRCCCICHKFCGFKIELHHIIQKAQGGSDTYENCIPLCLDCHAEVKAYDPKHPKGRRYTESELGQHRDRWYKKVRSENLVVVHPDCVALDRKLFLKIREILPGKGVQSLLYEIIFIPIHFCLRDTTICSNINYSAKILNLISLT